MIALPPLAVALAVVLPGTARAAQCPAPRPVAGVFHAVQTTAGIVLTYPISPLGTRPVNATQLTRGMTLSGAITGLSNGPEGGEMGLLLELDLVRLMSTGQGYGAGEMTVTTRPSVPFLSPAPAFRGRLNALLPTADTLVGYFAATGVGEHAGKSLRGRFTARLSALNPIPGGSPSPFGLAPTNPFGVGPPTNPFGGGRPTNPLSPGGSGPQDPFTGANPLANPPVTLNTTAALELKGAFGGTDGPTMLVENDPLPMTLMADAPDLSLASSGLFPLLQATQGSLSVRCRGGEVRHCSSGSGFPTLERIEARRGATGLGTIALRAGRHSARYQVQLEFDCTRTQGIAAESNFGYAQARIRLLGRGNTPVYEGTLDGVMLPLLSRGRPVPNRFVWVGFLVLNQKGVSGGVADSLRSTFTATGTFGRGGVPEIRFSAALGRPGEPFLRVVSGLGSH